MGIRANEMLVPGACTCIHMMRARVNTFELLPFGFEICRAFLAMCRHLVQRHSRHRFVVSPDVGVRAVLVFAFRMSSVVWVVAPEHLRCTCSLAPWGRQDDVIKARVELRPAKREGEDPWPDWFRQGCSAARVELPSPISHHFGEYENGSFKLIGLARLTSRAIQTHQGPLMNPDREGRLLLDTFHNPMDAALVKVIDFVKLMTPMIIKDRQVHRRDKRHRCKTNKNSNGNSNNKNNNSTNNPYWYDARRSTTPISASLVHQLFLPAFPESFSIAGTLLDDGTLLNERLQEWRVDESKMDNLLAHFLPAPFGSMIVAGYYFSTIVLGRSIQLPDLFSVDVPSAQWIAESKALHMQAFKSTHMRTHKKRKTNQRTYKQNNGEPHRTHIGFGCCFGWCPIAISRSDAAVDVAARSRQGSIIERCAIFG